MRAAAPVASLPALSVSGAQLKSDAALSLPPTTLSPFSAHWPLALTASPQPRVEAVVPSAVLVPVAGAGRRVASTELPPAGPLRQVGFDSLLSLTVPEEDRAAARVRFAVLRAVLSEDPAEGARLHAVLRETPGALAPILDGMYASMNLVLQSALPPGERWPLAVSLLRRYGGWLEGLRRTPGLPAPVAELVAADLADFFAEDVFVEEFARRFALERELAALSKKDGSARPATLPWQVPEPVPLAGRAVAERTEVVEFRLADILEKLRAVRERKDRLEARLRLARKGGFSDAFVQARAQELEAFRTGELQPLLGKTAGLPTRVTGTLFRKQLLRGRDTGGPIPLRPWRADISHVRLAEVPGGFLVRAEFETDLQDERVLSVFKRSIEDYWNGVFMLDGKAVSFRVEIALQRLAPGASFSPGAMKLTEGVNSAVTTDGIRLARRFRYTTPAHEFGHVLGLRDDYTEVYDGATRRSIHARTVGSVMGDGGVLRARHFQAAYGFLRALKGPRPLLTAYTGQAPNAGPRHSELPSSGRGRRSLRGVVRKSENLDDPLMSVQVPASPVKTHPGLELGGAEAFWGIPTWAFTLPIVAFWLFLRVRAALSRLSARSR